MNLGLFWLVLGDFTLSLILGVISAVAGVALLSLFELRTRSRVEECSPSEIAASHAVRPFPARRHA
jgi:hypothetical protein